MEPLDESYLNWLYCQVASQKVRRRSWWGLLRILYTTPFVWFVPNDDNRANDGRDLREEFIQDRGLSNVDPDWLSLPCSFLEMVVGLTRRLAFETEGDSIWWFWQLMQNLELNDLTDQRGLVEPYVRRVLYDVTFRNYSRTGEGGLFPLQTSEQDQRTVEIWYQMNAYLLENNFI